jgi:polyphosphate kinase 2 (PPK2 family)
VALVGNWLLPEFAIDCRPTSYSSSEKHQQQRRLKQTIQQLQWQQLQWQQLQRQQLQLQQTGDNNGKTGAIGAAFEFHIP